jgi:hypothetical protein
MPVPDRAAVRIRTSDRRILRRDRRGIGMAAAPNLADGSPRAGNRRAFAEYGPYYRPIHLLSEGDLTCV